MKRTERAELTYLLDDIATQGDLLANALECTKAAYKTVSELLFGEGAEKWAKDKSDMTKRI